MITMKKKILILLAVGFVITSCKKEYTCSCDGTAANQGIQTYTIKAKKTDEAKSVCDGYAENTGGLVVCELE